MGIRSHKHISLEDIICVAYGNHENKSLYWEIKRCKKCTAILDETNRAKPETAKMVAKMDKDMAGKPPLEFYQSRLEERKKKGL